MSGQAVSPLNGQQDEWLPSTDRFIATPSPGNSGPNMNGQGRSIAKDMPIDPNSDNQNRQSKPIATPAATTIQATQAQGSNNNNSGNAGTQFNNQGNTGSQSYNQGNQGTQTPAPPENKPLKTMSGQCAKDNPSPENKPSPGNNSGKQAGSIDPMSGQGIKTDCNNSGNTGTQFNNQGNAGSQSYNQGNAGSQGNKRPSFCVLL